MNEKKPRGNRKLSHEILGVLGICVVIALFLFRILFMCAVAISENYFFAQDIVLTDAQVIELDSWIFSLSLLVSVVFFVVLFLFLLGERLSYIREVLKGIDALRAGKMDYEVPLEGGNELTALAEAVNYLSATQRQVREKERALGEEKEQLIRTLSHDIRTPLTSIMAYSELLNAQEDCPTQTRKEYLELIQKKAQQIKELTDILLDGGKRNPEHFEDARLLMEQLVEEFEESLEDDYRLAVDLSGCPAFAGTFDVQELRRIFDNLISNIQKYADPDHPVALSIQRNDDGLVIRQENQIRIGKEKTESYQMGLNSIRRISHNYAGRVEIRQDGTVFGITITLSEI